MPHPTPEDLTGRTFGPPELRQTVLGPAGKSRHRVTLWRVRCACGAERVISRQTLMKPRVKAGCRSCAVTGDANRRAKMHAHIPTLTLRVWPRVCKTCGANFAGTARQVYCADHGPAARQKRAAAAVVRSDRAADRARRDAAMRAAFAAGRTVAAISREYGLAYGWVWQIVHRGGD